jgi:hypothetical protein
MGTKMLRLNHVYGKGNPIPCGKSYFFENIVLRDPADPFIPGTNIPRLKLTNLTENLRVAFEDEVYNISEALRAERDASPSPVKLTERGKSLKALKEAESSA